MDNAELFRKCVEDNKHSEIVTIPHKLKDGSDVKAEIRVLDNKQRRLCRSKAKKTVADMYEMKISEIENPDDMEEFREEVIYELLYASIFIPGTNTRFFPSAESVGTMPDDWITSFMNLYSQVNANASVAETVLAPDDENANRLIVKLKEGALDPSNFLAQSSAESQIHLMITLVKQLQNCLKDNVSLTLQLELLTKKTKAGNV